MTYKAHTKSLTLAALAAVMVLVSSPAFADKYHRDNDRDYKREYSKEYKRDYDRNNKSYRHDNRDRYNNHYYYYNPYYWRSGYGTHHSKYRIGRPLPRTVAYYNVPHHVLVKLRPAPRGTRYVMVDRDVLLINAATKNVIDAIALFSAVGNHR